MSGAGVIVGSMSGGFLSQLGVKYPHLFPEGTLFARFPYLAPMMLVSLMNLFGFVMGFFMLPETLARKQHGGVTVAASDVELTGLVEEETRDVDNDNDNDNEDDYGSLRCRAQ